jgi:hypothetical protein
MGFEKKMLDAIEAETIGNQIYFPWSYAHQIHV